MSESTAKTTADAGSDEKVKKGRGPAFPYCDLGKAVDRVSELASKGMSARTSVSPATIYGYWKLGQKSSAARQTLAALKYYGLVEYEGLGKERKTRLTNRAIVLVHDKDPRSDRRKEALRAALLSPEVYRDTIDNYGLGHLPPSDAIETWLTIERGFDRDSAEKAVRNLLASVDYAGLSEPEEMSDFEDDSDSHEDEDEISYGGAKLGDYVQWESQGMLQFRNPLKVRQISPDESYLAVEGHQGWIPMSQVIVEKAPAGAGSVLPPPPALPPEPQEGTGVVTLPGNKADTFTTSEGDVILSWPLTLSSDSLEDVEEWTKLILKKVRREVQRREREEEEEAGE